MPPSHTYVSHEFHQKCVDPWLKLKMTCPLCKHSLAAVQGEVPEEAIDGEEGNRRRRRSSSDEGEVVILPIII